MDNAKMGVLIRDSRKKKASHKRILPRSSALPTGQYPNGSVASVRRISHTSKSWLRCLA